ncbi:hypothetical protein DPMN_150408 [Dreissena polymorpha]|uniref:Uncharacterized protein n=1 Tax=Dreissena polymorpha TaxID=45954 RepID=A0A9D4J5Y8_DREPO|nr:hypothetical protein DPMN_150408 [Dreissena polymorpha]
MVSTPLADPDLSPFFQLPIQMKYPAALQPALTNGLSLHRAAVPGLRHRPFGV